MTYIKINNLFLTVGKGILHSSGIITIILFIGYEFFTPKYVIDSQELLPPLDATIWYYPLALIFMLNSIFFTIIVITSFSKSGGEFAKKRRYRNYVVLGMIFIISQFIGIIFFTLLEIFNLSSLNFIVNNWIFLLIFEIILSAFFIYHWILKIKSDQLNRLPTSKGGLIYGIIYVSSFVVIIFLFEYFIIIIFFQLFFFSWIGWFLHLLGLIFGKNFFGFYVKLSES